MPVLGNNVTFTGVIVGVLIMMGEQQRTGHVSSLPLYSFYPE